MQLRHLFRKDLLKLLPPNGANNIFENYNRNQGKQSIMSIKEKQKEFDLFDYDVIGFDLDCTLLRYNLNQIVPLIYNSLNDYLIKEKNYGKEIISEPINWDFIQKGLVLDIERGNIVKLNCESTIMRATHGSKIINQNDLKKIYGEEKKWDVAVKFFKDPLSTWNGPLSEKIRATLDYFDISAPLVFANLVDYMDSRPNQSDNYTNNWLDILDGLTFLFAKESFESNTSPFFTSLKLYPDLHLMKTDPKILSTILALKNKGILVFLLTGSDIDYANYTASYALGPNWKQYFDCIVAFAKKPGFFTQERQFYKVSNNKGLPDDLIPLDMDLPMNSTYCSGNWNQLLKSFSKKLNKNPNDIKCLHIGDNIIQDIYTPVKHNQMKSLAVCEELNENNNNFIFKNTIHSELWGSSFKIMEEETLFSNFLKNYSEFVVPTVDVLCNRS